MIVLFGVVYVFVVLVGYGVVLIGVWVGVILVGWIGVFG